MNNTEIIEKYVLPAIKEKPLWENWYIKEEIGSGTFGDVYRMEAKRSKRTDECAIKIEPIIAEINPYDSEERRRTSIEQIKELVENETEIMSELKDCPNIVGYQDEKLSELYIDGKFVGYYFLVRMELLKNVHKLIIHKKLNLSEKNIIKIALDIGHGIKAAHDNNIIHRDIKPENLFVSKKGIYKLGDFNISKHAEETGTKAGTPAYMAPEVYRGEKYNKQADIYSFGICLYQMMNKYYCPFEQCANDNKATQRRLRGEQLRPPVNASEGFSRIILKACAHNPEERYASIDDMLKELEALPITPEEPVPRDNNSTQYAGDEHIQTPTEETDKNGTEYIGDTPIPPPPNPEPTPVPVPSPVPPKNNFMIVFTVVVMVITLAASAFILFGNNDSSESESSESQKSSDVAEDIIAETSAEIITENSMENAQTQQEIPVSMQSSPEIVTSAEPGNYPPSFPYVSATSELAPVRNNDGTFYYNASNVIDNDYSTCWAEGAAGDGINENIFLSADSRQRVSEIIITNGLYTNSELFYKNNRVKDCRIEFSDGTYQDITLLGNYSDQSARIMFDPPVDTEYIKITILSVYSGNKYNDTCISEISVK